MNLPREKSPREKFLAKEAREMDMIDGLKTTSDFVYKLLDMICDLQTRIVHVEMICETSPALICELQLRMRQIEEKCQTPPPSRSNRFKCNLTCKDNVLKL